MCEKWIAKSESLDFAPALLTTGYNDGILDKSVRDSSRVMIGKNYAINIKMIEKSRIYFLMP